MTIQAIQILFLSAISQATPQAAPSDSLPSELFDLDEIVVTGIRAPRLLKDTPVQTRLITSRDIELTDATDIEDLMQQELPGVEFSYAMNQQTHLNFNGQGGQSVLFLVDGERMAGETMDDIDFTRLDMSNVDHIEIVKGASSALYGSNAGGGVINIITKRATKPFSATAGARLGKHSEQRYNLSLSARGSHVANTLNATRYSIANYDVHSAPNPVTRIITTVYGHSLWNFQDRFTWTPRKGLDITARAGYFFRELSRTADTPERYRDFSAGLRGAWSITDNDFLDVAYSFDQYDKSNLYKITGLDIRNYSNVQHSVRALYNHSFADGDMLTAGADFMRDYLLNTKLATRDRSQTSFDAFLQYDREFASCWEAVGALRYDYFSDGSISRLTPKISLRWSPRFDLNFRLGYGMGFRAPTLKEKYYDFDMAGIWIVNGNPSLKPETSQNITFSADWTHGNYNATLSAYFSDIHNHIATGVPYYRPDDATQLYLDYVNLRRYTVGGGEISLRARWSNGFSANITYALTIEHTPKDKEGHEANNQYLPARRHSMTARGDWTHSFSRFYSLTASLSGRALSGVSNVEYKDYYDISAGTVKVNYPPYTLWKISLSQNFGSHVRLSLALDNILNYRPKHYYLNCPLTDGIAFSAGLTVTIP